MIAVTKGPSTRTSASFIAAMDRLGGRVIPITQGVQFSSVSKGETLADTIRTLEQYSDVIVLRHPEVGSAQMAADYADVPVLNAGDGAGEDPSFVDERDRDAVDLRLHRIRRPRLVARRADGAQEPLLPRCRGSVR